MLLIENKSKNISCAVFLLLSSFSIAGKILNFTTFGDLINFSYLYYFYILLSLFLLILHVKINGKVCTSSKILIVLLIYYTIWYFHNNTIDKNDTFDNYIREIFMLVYVFTTISFIKMLKCECRYLKMVYVTFVILILFLSIISFKEINLKTTILNFWDSSNDVRYRVNFGFKYNNLAAELALSTIILSKRLKFKDRLTKSLINLYMFFIIIANNSRGTLLLFVVIELLFLFSSKRKFNVSKYISKLVILIGIFSIFSLYLLNNSNILFFKFLSKINRIGIVENYRLILFNDLLYMGTGRLSGGFFANKNLVGSIQTGYLEVFYYEILVTSGLIGLLFVFCVLYKISKCIRKNNSYYKEWTSIVFVYGLLLSFFEVYLFSNVYISSIVFLIAIGLFIDKKGEKII